MTDIATGRHSGFWESWKACGLVIAVTAAATLAIQYPGYLNHDVAYLTWVADRVMHGAVYGRDVYDINPLSVRDEAVRLVAGMGGVEAVRSAAAKAAADGGIDNWRWALRLTSLLLTVDPADSAARTSRATAARAIGQRQTSR